MLQNIKHITKHSTGVKSNTQLEMYRKYLVKSHRSKDILKD